MKLKAKAGAKIIISKKNKDEIRIDYPYLRIELIKNKIRIYNSFTNVTHLYKEHPEWISLNNNSIESILRRVGTDFEKIKE